MPQNLDNTVEYQVTLEHALVWSKNVPSVELFKLIGGKDVEAWARRLGITTPIIPDQALALGASCMRIDELTRAFAVFARNGALVDPVYVRRVLDRSGASSRTTPSSAIPFGSPVERLDRMVALAAAAHAEAGDPAAHRVAHLDAAPPGRHPRPRARHPRRRPARPPARPAPRARPWTSGSSATPRAG